LGIGAKTGYPKGDPMNSSMMKKIWGNAMIGLVIVAVLVGCKTVTEPPAPGVELTAVDVRCTEVWLKLGLSGNGSRDFVIKRDEAVAIEGKIKGADTLVVDTGLLPAKRYRYVGYRKTQGYLTESSQPLEVTTMDTTNHNFIWQADVLGDGNASNLRDVCIIKENDIWAVGEIYLKDSTGQFNPLPYNAIYWDGKIWKLERVSVKYLGNWVVAPLKAVFALSSTDIWVSAGVPIHGDGRSWIMYHLYDMGVLEQTDGSISQIWGSSTNDIFFGGSKGVLVHYDGSTWRKIETGTHQDIQDMWGVYDKNAQKNTIFCAVSSKYEGGEKKVLQILDNNVVKEFDWSPQIIAQSVWFAEDSPLYICGDGLFKYENKQWSEVLGLPELYKNMVRGNHQNDVFVAGDLGIFAHYNGKTWKTYKFPTFMIFHGLAVKDNTVVAVGEDGDRAILCRGVRTQ